MTSPRNLSLMVIIQAAGLLILYMYLRRSQDPSLATCRGSCPFAFNSSFHRDRVKGQSNGVNGGWKYDLDLIKRAHVPFDPGFARALVHHITWSTHGRGRTVPVTLGDIGAGVGQLGGWLRDERVTNVTYHGWDGGSNVESFSGQKVTLNAVMNSGKASFLVPHICWLDASSDLQPWADQLCGAPYDWVTSIEVGEHIPAPLMNTFLDNLVLLARHGIVLSWAVKGQGGSWHVNELNNSDVVLAMEERGLINDDHASAWLRSKVTSHYYLRDTVMVFRKPW